MRRRCGVGAEILQVRVRAFGQRRAGFLSAMPVLSLTFRLAYLVCRGAGLVLVVLGARDGPGACPLAAFSALRPILDALMMFTIIMLDLSNTASMFRQWCGRCESDELERASGRSGPPDAGKRIADRLIFGHFFLEISPYLGKETAGISFNSPIRTLYPSEQKPARKESSPSFKGHCRSLYTQRSTLQPCRSLTIS